MKKIKIILVISSLLVSACSTLKKPFYYQIKGKDGSQARMLGTIHFGVSVEDLPSYITDEFNSANPVYLEISDVLMQTLVLEEDRMALAILDDLDKFKSITAVMENPDKYGVHENFKLEQALNDFKELRERLYEIKAKKTSELYQPAYFTDGKSLKEHLSPQEWLAVEAFFTNLGVENTQINRMHIETVLEFMSVQNGREILVTKAKANRINPKWSMDLNLIKIAKEKSKRQIALDSENIIGPECDAELYLQSLRELISKGTVFDIGVFDDLEKAYRSGDEIELTSRINSQFGAKVAQCLVYDRNKMWIAKIDSQIKESKNSNSIPFFAFGAAHLFGEQGIIKALESQGYLVQRVVE